MLLSEHASNFPCNVYGFHENNNLFLAENTEKERRYGCVEERKDASDVSGYLLSLSCINVRLCGCVNIFLVFYSRI